VLCKVIFGIAEIKNAAKQRFKINQFLNI